MGLSSVVARKLTSAVDSLARYPASRKPVEMSSTELGWIMVSVIGSIGWRVAVASNIGLAATHAAHPRIAAVRHARHGAGAGLRIRDRRDRPPDPFAGAHPDRDPVHH